MTLIRLVLSVFLCATLLVAQNSGGNFIQPPASPAGGQVDGQFSEDSIFVVGESLIIQWQTDVPNLGVSLGLWQQDVSTDLQPITTITSNTTLDSYPWDGIPFQNLTYGRVFFMQIYDAVDLTLLATSHYFNMTGDKPGSSSSSSSSAAAASSTSSTTHPATTAPKTTSATASSSAAATSTAASGSSSGHTIAIGVGVGVGVGVLLAAIGIIVAVYFCLRNRRLKKRQSAAVSITDQLPYKYSHNHELDSKGTTTTTIPSQPSWHDSPRQELQ